MSTPGAAKALEELGIETCTVARYFSELDADASGGITMEELVAGLERLELPASLEWARAVFELADLDNSGNICYKEFEVFYIERMRMLEKVFRQIDRDGSGHITAREIRLALEALNLQASDDQIRAFLRRVDRDGDGMVSFKEFRYFLTYLPLNNPKAIFDTWMHEVFTDDAQSEFTVPRDIKHPSDTYQRAFEKLFCGGIAGATSRTLTAPIDRIKTIMQTSTTSVSLSSAARQIVAEGGARAFWFGNGTNCIKIAPETGIKFLAFDFFKGLFSADAAAPSVAERFCAGGAAGVVAQCSIYPLEIAKTRMSLAPQGHYKGAFQCIAQIARQEGVRALFAGLGPSVVGIVPYAGVDLAVNSILRERLAHFYEAKDEKPPVAAMLGCGMVSSTSGMLVAYPLGLVRTRLQAQGLPGATQYKGALDCLQRTVAKEGVTGLYRGLVPNLLKVLPATSISYAMYGELQRRFSPGQPVA